MPLIKYRDQTFYGNAKKTIQQALVIIEDLSSQGYTLTLRQLYYQMVAANMIANNEKEYKRLGRIICDAREAGLIDWYAIEDRGRSCYLPGHTPTPAEVLKNIEMQLRLNPWLDQPVYLVVGVEKAALEGVIERPSSRWRAPYMSCRGYLSASEAWRSGRRFERALGDGKRCVFLHLGDHDPSGIHMTNDNRTRLNLFARGEVEVERLALNKDQVDQYKLPPNPAKMTDTRAAGYVAEHGKMSWELDALSPKVIDKLISDAIERYVDKDAYAKTLELEAERRQGLRLLGMRWEEVEALVLGDELKPHERMKVLDGILAELPYHLGQYQSYWPQSVTRQGQMASDLAADAVSTIQRPSEEAIDVTVEGFLEVGATPDAYSGAVQGFNVGFDRALGMVGKVLEGVRLPLWSEDSFTQAYVTGLGQHKEQLEAAQELRKAFDKPDPVKPEPKPWEEPTEAQDGDEHDPGIHPDGFEPDEPLPEGFEEF